LTVAVCGLSLHFLFVCLFDVVIGPEPINKKKRKKKKRKKRKKDSPSIASLKASFITLHLKFSAFLLLLLFAVTRKEKKKKKKRNRTVPPIHFQFFSKRATWRVLL
jgi:hypothetical protein